MVYTSVNELENYKSNSIFCLAPSCW